MSPTPWTSPVENAPPIGTEHIGQHAADANAAAVQDLLHAIAHSAALTDQGPPVAGEHPHLTERLGRNMARGGQAELAHPRQPYAVGDVGLAALELLDLAGIDQRGGDAGSPPALRTAPASTPRCLPSPQRSTERSRSHATIASRPLASASKVRVSTCGSPAPGSHTRTATVICILCTSRPAARAWTTCRVSVIMVSPLAALSGGRRRRDGAGRTGLTPVTECGAFCRASTARGPGTFRGSEPTGQSQFGQREATLTIKTTATAPPPPLLLYRRHGRYVELHRVSRVTPLSCHGAADNARTMTVCRESVWGLRRTRPQRQEVASVLTRSRGGWGRSRASGGPGLWPGVDGARSRRGCQAAAAGSYSMRP